MIRVIEYVVIELAPLESEDSYISEYRLAFPVDFAAKLDEVADAIDSATCSNCNEGIGYLLHEDDDQPQCSGLFWRPVWLSREDKGSVRALCEGCAPCAN